jgi:hypothetical protein
LYYFVPGNTRIQVFAGLVPIDLRTLITIPASDLSMYFAIWTASLLSNTRYAVDTPFDGCDENCRSLILPGGIEIARQFNTSLNYTIFDDGLLNNSTTIRIENAPGLILKFETLEDDFLFNPDSVSGDCVFSGEMINDTLQFCVKQVNDSLAVGMCIQISLSQCESTVLRKDTLGRLGRVSTRPSRHEEMQRQQNMGLRLVGMVHEYDCLQAIHNCIL